MKVVEIYAGCGGMATGIRNEGSHHVALSEWKTQCAQTLADNGFVNVFCEDVSKVDFGKYHQQCDLLCGGPPCQAFSQAGKQLGRRDSRDGWPDALRALDEIRPRMFLFENVRGMLSRAFDTYRTIIIDRMVTLGYTVLLLDVDVSDHGVAQHRKRVFFVGFLEAKYASQFKLPPRIVPPPTLRTALLGLGTPRANCSQFKDDSHAPVSRQAKAYKGHTGSVLDAPAKTVLAGVHGVGGGNNCFTQDDGTLRYFTVREAARVQGFDDSFFIRSTSWTSGIEQIGNAVPPPVVSRIFRQMQLASA